MTDPITFKDATGHRWQALFESQHGQGSYYCRRATLEDFRAALPEGYALVELLGEVPTDEELLTIEEGAPHPEEYGCDCNACPGRRALFAAGRAAEAAKLEGKVREFERRVLEVAEAAEAVGWNGVENPKRLVDFIAHLAAEKQAAEKRAGKLARVVEAAVYYVEAVEKDYRVDGGSATYCTPTFQQLRDALASATSSQPADAETGGAGKCEHQWEPHFSAEMCKLCGRCRSKAAAIAEWEQRLAEKRGKPEPQEGAETGGAGKCNGIYQCADCRAPDYPLGDPDQAGPQEEPRPSGELDMFDRPWRVGQNVGEYGAPRYEIRDAANELTALATSPADAKLIVESINASGKAPEPAATVPRSEVEALLKRLADIGCSRSFCGHTQCRCLGCSAQRLLTSPVAVVKTCRSRIARELGPQTGESAQRQPEVEREDRREQE